MGKNQKGLVEISQREGKGVYIGSMWCGLGYATSAFSLKPLCHAIPLGRMWNQTRRLGGSDVRD